MSDTDNPRSYLAALGAYHRALADALREMIGTLPLRPGDHAIDVACGDGVYACWLADRVGPRGLVAAVDIAPECLDLARGRKFLCASSASVCLVRADAAGLPFDDGSFDLAWCAQSLYSLPDLAAALREMVRVVRPGGVVAVLENDTLHDMLLPWPVDLELEIRAAELKAFTAESETPQKFYVGRWLSTLFENLGLVEPHVRVWATTRQAPLRLDERFFLQSHLQQLAARAGPHLRPESRERLQQHLALGTDVAMLERSDLAVTFLNRLAWARRPGGGLDPLSRA